MRRALDSVASQSFDGSLKIIVVDDGSPCPASAEVEGLVLKPSFSLQVILQENAGVSAARNAGLKALDSSIDYIAFLDSDDIWSREHLATGIRALQSYDFYFADNERKGHHTSTFREHNRELLGFPVGENGLAEVEPETLAGLILRNFPTQASTVIYRRSIHPDCFFDENLKASGEDVLFFASIVSRARRACFSPKVMVECGDGINMFFSHLEWDDPKRIAIEMDRIKFISKAMQMPLPERDIKYLRKRMSSCKKDFVFLSVRYFLKFKKTGPGFSCSPWFLFTAFYVLTGKILGLYRPQP